MQSKQQRRQRTSSQCQTIKIIADQNIYKHFANTILQELFSANNCKLLQNRKPTNSGRIFLSLIFVKIWTYYCINSRKIYTFFVYNAVFYYFSKLFFYIILKLRPNKLSTFELQKYLERFPRYQKKKIGTVQIFEKNWPLKKVPDVKYCEIGTFSSDICIKNTENSKKSFSKMLLSTIKILIFFRGRKQTVGHKWKWTGRTDLQTAQQLV